MQRDEVIRILAGAINMLQPEGAPVSDLCEAISTALAAYERKEAQTPPIFAGGTISFKADCPKDAFDKILGNTKEDMDRMLSPGNTFDLSDGKDRTVTYISFPAGTKREDVVNILKCEKCAHWHKDVFVPDVGRCELIGIMKPKDENRANTNSEFFCYYARARKDETQNDKSRTD